MSDALCTTMPVSDDVVKMKKQCDQLLVFSWVLGLDREYDVLRSLLLGNKVRIIELDFFKSPTTRFSPF